MTVMENRHLAASTRRSRRSAAAQHGVVCRRQLSEAGLTRGEIEHRLARRRLHRVLSGVYAVGHPVLSRHGWWMAAVLAGGPGALLSFRAGGALWGVRPSDLLEITAPRRLRVARVTTHVADVPADERTVHRGIPVTTAARTLLDLAAVVPRPHLDRALHEAEVLRLGDAVGVHALLARYPARRGTAELRAALEHVRFDAVTDSVFEDRFLELVEGAGLPPPVPNHHVEGRRRDAVWLRERVVVELDGGATHRTRRGFEDDRAADRRLVAAGWRVVRVTWRQLRDRPDEVLRDVATILGATAAQASSSS
jgi:hypothetical protein